MFKSKKPAIGIVGLGYVGLPLAVEFGKLHRVIGFDIDPNRISELQVGFDRTLELDESELKLSSNLTFTINYQDLSECTIFIITVPTPIDKNKNPDLSAILKASETVGELLKNGDIVIYESTVYPGATEEECVPVLEKFSGLRFNQDFFCGYSPERINPGDKKHRIFDVIKITSGSTPVVAEKIDNLYSEIISAGTYSASSIKIAEAAKVIENIQRDVNIALINEFAIIFNKLGIDTESVLHAANTKWNFLPFAPGLVGGHCIGVDPYYLAHKAKEIGYTPEIILAGRRMNDSVVDHIVAQLIKAFIKKELKVAGSRVLVMGLTFKENCPDIRNSLVFNIINQLIDYDVQVDVYDPWVDNKFVSLDKNINLISYPLIDTYDGILLAVAHRQFSEMGEKEIRSFGKLNCILFDVKCIFQLEESDLRL